MGNTSNFDKFSEWDIGRTEIGWILIPPFPGSSPGAPASSSKAAISGAATEAEFKPQSRISFSSVIGRSRTRLPVAR